MIVNACMGRIRAALESLSQYRRIKSRLFAGNPVILEIGRNGGDGIGSMSLLYKNGLVLTLGDEGILDFQDKDFGQYLGSPGFGNRAAMVHLHKIVLKSLIRYMVHAGITPAQRERAAEAASKLYLAEVEASTDWVPGPAAAVVHRGLASATGSAFGR